jgi:hypothetical protein
VPDGHGMELAPGIWLFAAISIPLTVAVFLCWFWFHGSVYYVALSSSGIWVANRLQAIKNAARNSN